MPQNEQQEKDYLKEMAPTLFGKKHDIPANPPPGYFDNLPGKLSQRIKAEKILLPKAKVIRLINFQNMAIAAGIALLLALIPVARHFMDALEKSETKEKISFEMELNEDIDVDVLESYFDEEFLYASIESHELNSWQLDDNISDAAIIDYLMDETDHFELITNYNE